MKIFYCSSSHKVPAQNSADFSPWQYRLAVSLLLWFPEQDWYQIVLPKKAKFSLELDAISNSNLEFQMVDSKGNVMDGSVALSCRTNLSKNFLSVLPPKTPLQMQALLGLIAAISQNFSKEFLSLTLNVYEDETCTIPCGDSIYLLGDKIANTGSFVTSVSA